MVGGHRFILKTPQWSFPMVEKVNEEASFDWFSHFPERWSSPLIGW